MSNSVSQDLYNIAGVAESLAPAARTTSASGTAIDLQGKESALVVFHVGTWTDGTHTFTVQESDTTTDGDFANAAAAALQGSAPTVTGADNDGLIAKVGYVGTKRYVRARCAITGSPSTGLVASACVVTGHARHNPVS